MSIVKVIEVIASSPKSWDDAAESAVEEASKSVKNIKHFYAESMTALVDNGKITEWRVTMKVTFVLKG